MPDKNDKAYWREYQREYQKRWRQDNLRYNKENHKEARQGKGLLSIFSKSVNASDYFFLVDDIVEDLKDTPRPYTNSSRRTHRGICRLMFKYIPEVTLPMPLLKEVAIHFQAIEAYKKVIAKNIKYKNIQELFNCIKMELPEELEKREFTGLKGWLEFTKITQR